MEHKSHLESATQQTQANIVTEPLPKHQEGNKIPLYVLDLGILFFGLLIITVLRKTALGERLGKLLRLIVIGIIAIALNHFIDTLFVHDVFVGRTILNHDASLLLHHLGNLIGFVMIFIGFYLANKNFRYKGIK